jgi:hypothetical protein
MRNGVFILLRCWSDVSLTDFIVVLFSASQTLLLADFLGHRLPRDIKCFLIVWKFCFKDRSINLRLKIPDEVIGFFKLT